MSAASTSRRVLLTAGAAAIATARGASPSFATSAPDPVLSLLKAERIAWTEFDAACGADSDLEEVWFASEWNRQPRALIGHFTRIMDDDFNPIPATHWRAVPHYMGRQQVEDLHEKALEHIADAKVTEERAAEMRSRQEARRDELLSRIEADAAEVEAHRVALGLPESSDRVKRTGDAASAALRAVFAVQPTTAAGLLAMLDVCWERSEDQLCGPAYDAMEAAFAAVRTFVGGKA